MVAPVERMGDPNDRCAQDYEHHHVDILTSHSLRESLGIER